MKRVLLSISIAFSMLTAFADENVLQSIEIEPVKDTYNIVLVSDKAVDVKKTVESSNKITLSMKDIRASKTLNTIYNNVSSVDSVMIEPNGNGLKIFVQADNAAASTVTFDALTTPVAMTPIAGTKNIKLSNPIDSYAPIYKESFEDAKTSSMFDRLKSSSTVANIKDSINEEISADSFSKVFSFALVGLLIFFVTKLFRRKETEMKIGLSQSLNEREIDMYRSLQPISQSYTTEKPYTSVNYGINAYKKENVNPYENEQARFHNPKLRSYVSPMAESSPMQTITRPNQSNVAMVSQPQVKKMTTPVNNAPVNQANPNIDNLKFLESMTAIYEKSGRHDLARGLKASLGKNIIK